MPAKGRLKYPLPLLYRTSKHTLPILVLIMSQITLAVQTATIATSLMGAGGIAALSLFDVPMLQSQPASRSLPSIRWLFSRGSHIFPTTAAASGLGFAYLAIAALPQGRAVSQMLRLGSNGTKINGYLAAALLNFGIGAFTTMVMIPTNFALIEMNEKKGGARSETSAKEAKIGPGERSAEDSVNSSGDVNQFKDLSGPQAQTSERTTADEDEKARELLEKFKALNFVRAVLGDAGGIVGLIAALA